MGITLVAFHADFPGHSFYRRLGDRLRTRCQELGIPHDVREVECAEHWLLNTARKAQFVRDMVEKLGPVLYVDVDTKLKGNPLPVAESTLEGMDVALTGYPHGQARGKLKKRPGRLYLPLRIMGFAHAWSGSPGCMRLLDRWCEHTSGPLAPIHGDHRLLQLSVNELGGEVTWKFLPEEIGKRGKLARLGLARGAPGRRQGYAIGKGAIRG